jgi:hypothetical protein
MKRIVLCAALLVAVTGAQVAAQEFLLKLPRPSPRAKVTQTIGITDITVDYGRPGVKGRKIWGSLVPYDRVWRSGADENSYITFSTPVSIGGHEIAAGSYGIHIIPGRVYWTIILSTQYRAWGSFTYDESEDVVRVQARPHDVPHRERLMYYFEDIAPNSVRVSTEWEQRAVSFEVTVDVNATVVEELRDTLRGRAGRWWAGWFKAAEWCMEHNTNLDEALGWIERSIASDRNFINVRTKALILEKQGYTEEAQTVMREAVSIATESQVLQYAELLMADGETDRAISVLKENLRKNPESWRAHTALADAFLQKNEKDAALELYEAALTVTDDQRVTAIIHAIMDEIKKNH